jgi:DNA-directed RNA polymerase specialized sigma24 family protein
LLLSWDDAWPRVTAKARRVLLNRGAPADLIEDALQSAALHLLDRSKGFDSFEGMIAWVIEVAWNETKMAWRRQARVEVGKVPDQPGGPDPAAAFQFRAELAAVLNAFAALTDDERHAISSAIVDGGAFPLTPAVKMRRHRARQRLGSLAAAESGSWRVPQPRKSRMGATPLP